MKMMTDGCEAICFNSAAASHAGRISTRRETVTKELIAMEREGLVRRSRGALTLVDVPGLLAIIAEDTESQDFKA
jgi:hypothetical protein